MPLLLLDVCRAWGKVQFDPGVVGPYTHTAACDENFWKIRYDQHGVVQVDSTHKIGTTCKTGDKAATCVVRVYVR